MRRLPRYLLVAVFGLLLGGPVQAREWLVVGTYFPQVYERTTEGHFIGLAPAVLRRLAVELGDSLRFELHPWARAQLMVELGQADILVGPYRSAEREARFAFAAEPFYQDSMVLFARRDHEPPWGGFYPNLQGRRIAVVRGWTYGAQFEQARQQFSPVVVETVENGLRMLAIGRVDLLASNQRNTRPFLVDQQLAAQVRELQPYLDIQRGYFAFPRDAKHAALRQRIDEQFRQFIASGRLASLGKSLGVAVP